MRHRFYLITAVVLVILSWNLVLSAEEKAASPETALVQSVLKEFQAHDYKKVIRLYREFTASKPERYLPLVVKVLYSQSLADTGEIDDAIDSLRGVLLELPSEVDPLQLQYDLANLLFLQKRYEESKTAYRKLLVRGSRYSQILSQAKDRLALMKDRDGGKKKDFDSLEMMDLETALEAGVVPDGSETLLQNIELQDPRSSQSEEAKRLLVQIKDLRTRKAQAMLDEARRLFDVEKKFVEVQDILDQIQRSYADVSEKPSIEALRKAVQGKIGKPTKE